MKKLITFSIFFITLMSCDIDINEEIPCIDSIELGNVVIGEAFPNRHVVLEDIYIKGDTIFVQTTYEYGLDQYRIVIDFEGENISGGYKWWYASITPSHLSRNYKIPAIIPDCYDNINITFGIFDSKIQDYIEHKSINLER